MHAKAGWRTFHNHPMTQVLLTCPAILATATAISHIASPLLSCQMGAVAGGEFDGGAPKKIGKRDVETAVEIANLADGSHLSTSFAHVALLPEINIKMLITNRYKPCCIFQNSS